MFFVYSGYVSPDHYDNCDGPTYKIKEFRTADEVIAYKKEFDEGIYSECSHVMFRVFEGQERTLTPIEKVTDYALK